MSTLSEKCSTCRGESCTSCNSACRSVVLLEAGCGNHPDACDSKCGVTCSHCDSRIAKSSCEPDIGCAPGECGSPECGRIKAADCRNDCGQCSNCVGSCMSPSIRMTPIERAMARQAIEQYQFEQVRYRLTKEQVVPGELVDVLIDEFRRFLTVVVHSQGSIGMISPLVDEVWHAFILHTGDYSRFCQSSMGEYLHHAPNTPYSPSDPSSVSNFISGYNALFGELHPVWTMHLS